MDINEKIYVGVYEVAKDFDISKQKAYQINKQLNKQLKDNCPTAIIISGKVNRIWYEEACLKR
ncbi:MAG: hypothetical protein IKW90_04205 [Lachnospiraceae bacterium]|nr:hypothetical protein [Lachnospiraceae bacterium]